MISGEAMGWDPERRRADLRRGYGAGSGEEEVHSAGRSARGRGALHRAPRREALAGRVRPSAGVSRPPGGE